MKLLLNLFGLLLISSFIVSCKKELSSENNAAPVVVEAAWEFTQGDTTYKGDIDTAYLSVQPGTQLLTIEGLSIDGRGAVVLQIIDDKIMPGSYTSPQLYFQYSEEGAVVYENIPYDPGFTVTVTTIDSVSISGTFSGKVASQDGSEYTITNGKFTAAIEGLTVDIPEPEIDYFPFAKSWTYQNQDDAADKLIITATGTQQIGDQIYTVFENSKTLEKRYFRKDGSNYYEYITFDFGGASSSAPSFDLLALKDDASEGDRWETEPFNVSVSGLTAIVKIGSEITSKGATFNILGVNYTDVIEVTTDIYIFNGTDFEVSPDLGYTTLYANGFGMIFYVDKNDKSRWLLESYSKD